VFLARSLRICAAMAWTLWRGSNCAIASAPKPRRIARLRVKISLVVQLRIRGVSSCACAINDRNFQAVLIYVKATEGYRRCTDYAAMLMFRAMDKLSKREKLKRLSERLMRTTDEAECQRIVSMIEQEEAKSFS
jgi:hypothetical protein